MKEWLRRIPHPSYGNYGGAKNTCEQRVDNACPLPIDWMDETFLQHDIALKKAKTYWEVNIADRNLYNSVKSGDVKKLKHPIWGRIYRRGVLTFFRY